MLFRSDFFFCEFQLPTLTKKEVLEKIKKFINKPRGFFHIVSLNPENIVVALGNRTFKRVVADASLRIIDGVGIVRAAQMLHLKVGERYPGVDLMENLISLYGRMSLTVLFIGGKAKLADSLAKCYSRSYPEATFIGIQGIKKATKPTTHEEHEIERIVRTAKPHIVFVAFGSPLQELWLNRHKKLFNRCIVMGVGGGFDYASGLVKRPNPLIRQLGLEWLTRLLIQPWRLPRQLRLIKFMYFVIKQKVHDTLEIPHS